MTRRVETEAGAGAQTPAPGRSPVVTRAEVARAHARIATSRHERALLASVLRNRSVHGREILAEVAWPGHRPDELDTWALEHADHPALPPGSNAAGIADYARVLAVQLDDPDEQRLARSLYEALRRSPQWPSLRPEHVEVLAHLRLLGGDPDGAREIADDARLRADLAAAVVADSLHPRLAPAADPVAWAAAFNAALHSDALAPILPPEHGRAPSLDEMRVEHRPPVRRPERVTVLMSAFRRGPTLLTAVRSVLAQTWTELELLVIDDASGPGPAGEWERVLREAEGLDPRVTVIRKAVNGGTYRARNTALRLATGDFAIVIDSDDWWHPQTLELLVAPLLTYPGLMATRAQGVRLTPDLMLSRVGYRPRKPSAPTVLYRLPEVLGRMGFYDPTRKGADNEHAKRMEAAFGVDVLDIRETTTLLRGDGATLSSDEFANGWRHPARHAYKSLYGAWHAEIAGGRTSPFLDPDAERPYPEPGRWAREVHPLLQAPRSLDLVLAGDWRRFGGPQRSMVAELDAALEAGLTVGVMHLEALRFMDRRDCDLAPELVALVRAGRVQLVLPDDDLDVGVLLVRYPPVLQYPPRLDRRVRARHVLVMANQAPVEADGSDPRYVVRDVTERAEELFGRPVSWVPQSPTIRRLLLEQDPTVPLVDWDNPGILPPDTPRLRPVRAVGEPVVIGRHSRDDRIKFPPDWEQMVAGYTFPRGHEVRILGGARVLRQLREAASHHRSEMPELPDGWWVMEYGAEPVPEFLAELDFYLYLDHPDSHEAFGRSLLEAAASGVLTIAHPKHRPTFGDALDYAEPGEAQALVERYVADPQAYADRVERTLAAVHERFSATAFVTRVRELIEQQDRPAATPSPAGGGSPAAPGEVVLTLHPGAGVSHALPTDTVHAAGVDLVQVPLRSAADAERAESITVLHAQVPEGELGPWLRAHLTGWSSPSWSPAALLGAAPAGVLAVLLRRDGETHALGRGSWESSAPPDGPPAGPPPSPVRPYPDVPAPWQDVAWWEARPPSGLFLRAPRELP